MTLCSDGHKEICYEEKTHGFDCPLCKALRENENLEGEVGLLREKVGDLEVENDQLRHEPRK